MANNQVQELEGMESDVQYGFIQVTTIKELFELFQEEFLDKDAPIPARNIVRQLRDDKVIPEAKETEIIGAKDAYEAASILYRHMRDHADKESAQKLFNIMINADGFPRMNALGQKMLDALQNIE